MPPATDRLELAEKLRASCGLRISDALNGAARSLQDLVQFSTHPDVANRIDSAADFLNSLDGVEEELTAPAADTLADTLADPRAAQKGDRLVGGFTVLKRLGGGAPPSPTSSSGAARTSSSRSPTRKTTPAESATRARS